MLSMSTKEGGVEVEDEKYIKEIGKDIHSGCLCRGWRIRYSKGLPEK